ncbi:MAG: iron ABC transporter permease [Spirochaetes bacterium]|jgi:iron(III) transport system permease protein|nr:iron ABC transporter permease [Spirochaetota bacterium]
MFADGISNAAVIDALLRSLSLSLAVAFISGAAGCLVAWLVTRSDIGGGRALSGLFSMPYAIPAYLLGMAWIVLGNPAVGAIKEIFPESGVYGFHGMVLVESTVAFAFPYLELKAGFERMDPSLEEAARMSGARPWRVFRDVSFPLLWPPMVNGMCLSFLYTLSSFGVPAMLGMPVRQFVLTTLIYSQFKLGGMAGIAAGLRLSLLLLFMAMLVLVLSNRLVALQRRRGGAITGSRVSRPGLVRLGRGRVPFTAVTWTVFAAAVALPWGALAFSAMAPVAGDYAPSAWTMRNLEYVLNLPEFREALVNSLALSISVATFVVGAGFLLAFAAVRRGSRAAGWIIEAMGVPFSTPGTVIAILLIFVSTWAAAAMGRFGLSFDSPVFWMGFAYALKYSAVSARMLAAAYRQVHPSLEEAAVVSGATTFILLRTIWFPLLSRTVIAAWFLTALPMFTELTMSVLLTGPGGATMGTVLFQLQEYADQPSAAALAWILLSAALLGAFFMRGRKAEEILEGR